MGSIFYCRKREKTIRVLGSTAFDGSDYVYAHRPPYFSTVLPYACVSRDFSFERYSILFMQNTFFLRNHRPIDGGSHLHSFYLGTDDD